ncbi:lysosomal acid glucosylceramidase-like [Dermacentor silvarum]|uniref:lysosomal acid glucosylceramidase-like n=1 Tax=Dermacentor silvarum TaxID=543639 RepID=UPI002101544C|nr:lysosomal acid glucosylceramidase-like [Dermacentor silvarum]
MGRVLFIAVAAVAALIPAAVPECHRRDYGHGSVVCVCNATYCDFAGDIGLPPSGSAFAFESSKDGLRFAKTTIPLSRVPAQDTRANDTLLLVLDSSKTHQIVYGFGGAFTDAAGINVKSLPEKLQDDLIKSYYAKEGIAYNMGRVPLASTDFSERKYTYDDTPGDLELTNFTLAQEDLDLKIPYIKKATSLVAGPVLLIGSAWSSPAWMKTSNSLEGEGVLIGEPGSAYYKSWAKYYVRFLQEYERHGIRFYGVTAQNEPTTGFTPAASWQTLGFTAQTQKEFIKLDMGPALDMAGYGADNLQLLIFDDSNASLPQWSNAVLTDPEAAEYVRGVAVHRYTDKSVSPAGLDHVHDNFPDKFILSTQACAGSAAKPEDRVLLGSWERAEEYASNIIEDFNHWVNGWIDWNLALNTEGGPSWAQKFVDSPIIVNATAQEFYKQPMYYALGQFSKFLPMSTARVESHLEQAHSHDTPATNLEYTAFFTPNAGIVVIVLNKDDKKYTLKIKDVYREGSVQKVINERSITTFVWRAGKPRPAQ